MTSHHFHIIVFSIPIRQFFRMVKTITWKVFLRFFTLVKSYNILTSHLINITCCDLFIDMTRIAIIITCRFIITVVRNVLLRRCSFFKWCNFSATMTVYETCHHLAILMNNITFTIFTGFNVTIIWNIIFLRLNPLFRLSHFFTCQDIHMFGYHLSIEVTQISIRVCFCFHKMIAWESTRAMKAFFSTC